jgi:ribosomal protein S17E
MQDDKIQTGNDPQDQNPLKTTNPDDGQDTATKKVITNPDDGEDDEDDDIDDPVLLKAKLKSLKEAQKKAKSDSDRGVQKILKEKKDAEEYVTTFRKSVRLVRDDKANLVQIHEENPKVAKEILEEYFDWMTFDEFVQSELDGKVPPKKIDPDKEREKIRKEVEAEYEAKQATDLMDKYCKDFTDKEKEDIVDEFMEIVGKKRLSVDLVKKYFKVAVSIIKPSGKIDKEADEIKKQTAGKGGSSWNWLSPAQLSVKKYLDNKRKSEW